MRFHNLAFSEPLDNRVQPNMALKPTRFRYAPAVGLALRYELLTSRIGYLIMNEDPEIEYSEWCQKISSGGKTLSVDIYRIKGTVGWSLEIVDEFGNSTVWDDLFESDAAAITEAKKSILEDTAGAYVGPSDGKPDGKWR